ncbi:MAG: phosphatase PAP2 family protein [Desulfobacteraceae bacterium]|nr:phosphatase PAP2 family protein [Desulfobacteraceae bacterium]
MPETADTTCLSSTDGAAGISLKERLGLVFLVYGFFLIAYLSANRFINVAEAFDFSTPFDRATRFIPAFIYPIWVLYGMLVLPAFMIKDRKLLWAMAYAFMVLILGSVLLFILIPVQVPRPDFVANNLSERLVAAMYTTDRPVCGFPSLHVSTSLLAAMIMYRQNRWLGAIFYLMFVITAVGILFVKQHVLMDIVGGAAIASGVYYLMVERKLSPDRR